MKMIFSEYGKTIIAVITAGALIAMLITGGFLAKALSTHGNAGRDISYSQSDSAFFAQNNIHTEPTTEFTEPMTD